MADKKTQKPVFSRQPQTHRPSPSRPVYDYDQATRSSGRHTQPSRPVYDYHRQEETRSRQEPSRPVYDYDRATGSAPRPSPSRPAYDYQSPASERPKAREPAPFVNEVDDAARRRTRTAQAASPPLPRNGRPAGGISSSSNRGQQSPRGAVRQREWHATPQQEVPLKPRAPLYDQQADQRAARQGTVPPRKKVAKRTARKKKQELTPGQARRRRRIRYLLAGIFVTAALAAGVVVSAAALFKIKTVSVQQPEGGTAYTDDQIVAAFGQPVGENMFGFSPDDSAASILQALPYLETVEIQRRLPDTVIIEVTPAVEYCAVSSDAGWVVCSSSLKVLRIDSAAPEGLIQVQGAVADAPSPGQPLVLTEPDKLGAMQQVLSKAQAQGLTPITEINVSDLYEISFLYDSRIRIVLGTVNDLDYKINWAWRLVTPGQTEDGLTEEDRGTLDVSSRNEDGRGQAIWRSGSL